MNAFRTATRYTGFWMPNVKTREPRESMDRDCWYRRLGTGKWDNGQPLGFAVSARPSCLQTYIRSPVPSTRTGHEPSIGGYIWLKHDLQLVPVLKSVTAPQGLRWQLPYVAAKLVCGRSHVHPIEPEPGPHFDALCHQQVPRVIGTRWQPKLFGIGPSTRSLPYCSVIGCRLRGS